MSKETLHAAVRNTMVPLATVAIMSTTIYAAGPNGPPDPNHSGVKRETVAQVSAPPQQGRPAPPTVRSPASFTPQMPLSEAIDILRNCTTPPLNLIVLWRDLDNAGIYRDTPIGIDGIPGLRISQYLDLLAASLSAGAPDKIGYTVHQGVITIATISALPAPRYTTRVYDIRDLTAPPANYSFPQMGLGGMYGGQMMGLTGGYGGGLGTAYGMGSSYFPGGYGSSGAGGLPGFAGNSYGGTRARSGAPRGR